MEIAPKTFVTHRLVKSEDLNHHGTLFAGRSAEWFVEAGFVSATAGLLDPKKIVCLKIYGMEFLYPVRLGSLLCYESKVVLTGRSSLMAYISARQVDKPNAEIFTDGFIRFVHVDENTHAMPHNITIAPVIDEDKALMERAQNLPK
ncbi:MAG: acyl-CoA thioesterase [Prevotellaceae bacterium]|jgi:acyl-CoA hydrolase|nr:acyl-CoA thioesterase [Prevotellaceae bacterium]